MDVEANYEKLYQKLKKAESAFEASLKRQFGKQAASYRHQTIKFDSETRRKARAFAKLFGEMAALRKTSAKAKRKANPSPRSVAKAKNLYEQFSGHRAKKATTVNVTIPDTLTVVGPCVAIAYECVRDGEKAQYQHEFSKSAAPLLCASPDGSQLFLIGGAFEFRDTGINDI